MRTQKLCKNNDNSGSQGRFNAFLLKNNPAVMPGESQKIEKLHTGLHIHIYVHKIPLYFSRLFYLHPEPKSGASANFAIPAQNVLLTYLLI